MFIVVGAIFVLPALLFFLLSQIFSGADKVVVKKGKDLVKVYTHWETDPILGVPFQVQSVQTPDYVATLVRLPRESTSSEVILDTTQGVSNASRGAVLYIHGYNDYFFQKELAKKMDSAGYAFYAVDLHYFGRSYVPGMNRCFMRSVEDYFGEIDEALAQIQRENPGMPITLITHSLGGLVASLYMESRPWQKEVSSLVLNSPFLDMNLNPVLEYVGMPVVAALGSIMPDFSMNTSMSTVYGQSLHKGEQGEWSFDTTLKSFVSPKQDLGWIRGVYKSQMHLQKGLSIDVPILVMHSGCSIRTREWQDSAHVCDMVLDIADIEKYGEALGPSVTQVQIDGALHDVFLSRKDVREKAYKVLIEFLEVP